VFVPKFLGKKEFASCFPSFQVNMVPGVTRLGPVAVRPFSSFCRVPPSYSPGIPNPRIFKQISGTRIVASMNQKADPRNRESVPGSPAFLAAI
jgi:hypothetical protein